MTTFRKILVGLELTPAGTAVGEGSEQAVAQALDLAPRLGASVLLLHASALEEHYDRTDGVSADVWRHREGLSDEARAALDEATRPFADAGVDVSLELVSDRAHRAIITTVERERVDLVLVGKREPSGFDFDDRPLGAIALKLLRHCPAAVWTVSKPAKLPLKRILAATDLGGEIGARVVATAGRLAAAHGAELVVLHARPRGLAAALRGDGDSEPPAEHVEDAVASVLARVEGAPRPEVVVTDGSPTGSIVRASRERDPDLLVLGTVARTGVRAALVGNTAERIFGLVDRPLLTLKPR